MEVKINREIRNYTESVFFGLSLRQFIFAILAVAVAVGLYFLLKPYVGTETVSWVCTVSYTHLKAAEIKSRIAAISKELVGLRKELALCDGIAVRSGIIKEKIKTVREDENQRKENRENEHIRRRSRTNR